MASKKVASLYIDVGASTAKLTSGLNKAKARVTKFQRSTKKSFAGISRAVFSAKGALLSFAGVGGLGLLISNAMKTADEIGKMSDRLNMSAETFQALHHQAGLFGVSSGMVNSSIERMVKRLGEAANGTGAAKKALDELGISAERLIGLNADEQYKSIADAIGGLATHSERAAATAAIFGREGIKMVGMFEDGAGGIERARAELEAFGIAMDRIQIKKIENANDAFHRVGQVIKGAGAIVAAELSPFLEAAANWFLEMAKQSGGFGEITQSAMSGAADAIGFVLTAVDYLSVGYQTLKLGVLAFATVSLAAFDALLDPIRAVNDLLGIEQPEAIKFVTALTESFVDATIEGQQKLSQMIGSVGENADIVKGKLSEIKQAADEVANIQVNPPGAIETPEEAAASMVEIKAAEQQAIDEAYALRSAADETYRQEKQAADNMASQASLNGAGRTFGTLSTLMSAQSKKLFKIGKAAAIASALINTYQAITATMAATPYPWNIPLAIAQGVAGVVQVQNIRAQQYGGARVFGGEVIAGKRYRVGESGSEDFVPSTNGTIVPNNELNGGSKTAIINITALDSESVSDLFIRNKQSLYNTVFEAFADEGRAL